ncbi:hypothetical protein D029_4831C, partial [Vibrio parahaemolyticus 970107]
IVKKLTY